MGGDVALCAGECGYATKIIRFQLKQASQVRLDLCNLYSLENSYSLEQIEEMTLNDDFKFLKTIEEIFSYDKYSLQTEKEFILYKNGNTVKIKENLENKKYRIYFQDEFIGLDRQHHRPPMRIRSAPPGRADPGRTRR